MHYLPTAAVITRLQAARLKLMTVERAIVSGRNDPGPQQRQDEADVHDRIVAVEAEIDRLVATVAPTVAA